MDPEGGYEAKEQVWTALLPARWSPIGTFEQLRGWLEQLVAAFPRPAPGVPLRAVAAVMTFLAAHPDRRGSVDEELLAEALREAFPYGAPPRDVEAWLEERRRIILAQHRRHGARTPRRHSRSRPLRPEAP